MKLFIRILFISLLISGCSAEKEQEDPDRQILEEIPEPAYTLTKDQTHNKFSRTIEPALRVSSGAVIEIFTEEATDGQLTEKSKVEDLDQLSFDPIHPLTGPVYIEGAEPGDVLAVKLHRIEVGDWGWTAIIPGFGFLADEFTNPYLKTFDIDLDSGYVDFNDRIRIPLRPFAGVIGVAPATDSLLSTIPPRANGGNMDDPSIVEGTTVYLPVFVEGALFSIGDAHAVQGLGEVCGTAVEAPMRFILELNVIKNGRAIKEPQYETDEYYAVTAFGTTIDEAARKATQYMIDYLTREHDLKKEDAYALCSLAGDLKIAEVVDVPHMLVTMHMPKGIFKGSY